MEVYSKSIQHIVEFNTVSHNMCVFLGDVIGHTRASAILPTRNSFISGRDGLRAIPLSSLLWARNDWSDGKGGRPSHEKMNIGENAQGDASFFTPRASKQSS